MFFIKNTCTELSRDNVMKKSIFFLFSILCFMIPSLLHAQFIEDAIRIAEPVDAVNARSAGMGNAFIAVADDFSALYWNPAGLGQLRHSEFSLALTNLNASNKTSFLGQSSTYDNSSTHLNSIGMALPFPVSQGSLVLAAGYNRLVNFTGALSAKAFNPTSSIQPSLLNDIDEDDMSWLLGLQEDGTFEIPVNSQVMQTHDVLESGNLGAWSFGGSVEVARNLLVGISLNVITGTYRYERTFVENDDKNVYTDTIHGIEGRDRIDFQSMELRQTINQDISGWSSKIGLLYNVKDVARFGITVQTPIAVTIEEEFRMSGESHFANATTRDAIRKITNAYDVSTSWVFGFGASVNPVSFVTLSADADITDYSTITFDEASAESVLDQGFAFKKYLGQTVSFRFGAEVTIPSSGLTLRGGYGMSPTPFLKERADDMTQVLLYGMGYRSRNYDLKTLSFGAGYKIDDALTVNAAYMLRSYKTFTLNYIDPRTSVPFESFKTYEDVSRSSMMLSFAYSF
jgi:long-subunit fatty acid transport protein